ncbi:MAG: 2OG-Fe(II) oxygenase, partial [Owenweeksia sp.]
DWHMDFGAGEISHRKLSMTVQLSDPADYEGGDLEFMINQKVVTAPRTRGTVIVFPSFILHRVTPVTKGVRHSVVGWVSGTPFR